MGYNRHFIISWKDGRDAVIDGRYISEPPEIPSDEPLLT